MYESSEKAAAATRRTWRAPIGRQESWQDGRPGEMFERGDSLERVELVMAIEEVLDEIHR
jgi:hypothetical protein